MLSRIERSRVTGDASLPTLATVGQERGNYAKADFSHCRKKEKYRNRLVIANVLESLLIVYVRRTVRMPPTPETSFRALPKPRNSCL